MDPAIALRRYLNHPFNSETCKQKQHKKVLDKGKPDDVMPGILGIKEHLPTQPLSGMLNKHGGKVRLTFKLENDQVWIGKYLILQYKNVYCHFLYNFPTTKKKIIQ